MADDHNLRGVLRFTPGCGSQPQNLFAVVEIGQQRRGGAMVEYRAAFEREKTRAEAAAKK